MHRVHINIGSNQGDRKALIGRAVALLAEAFAPARLSLSSYVESAPWGYDSPNPFLNRGVMLLTDAMLSPEEVLERTQSVERIVGGGMSHRNPDGSYRDRLIDIDIIDIDGMAYQSPTLTLPHPRARLRNFVLRPLAELDPSNPLLKM